MLNKYKNILVVRFSSLGDVILTTPVLESLKAFFPSAKLTFLTKERYASLLENNRSIDEFILFKNGGMTEFLRVIHTISSRNFDLIIDLHRNLRSQLLRLFFWRTDNYKVNKRSLERRLLVWFKLNRMPEGYHVTKSYLDTIRPLIDVNGLIKPRIFLYEEELKKADSIINGIGLHDKIIAFAPGAKWQTKRWPEEGFAALGDIIIRCSRSTVVLLGDKNDRAIASNISGLMKRQPVDLAGKLTLRETAAMIKRSSVIVTNDSGLMHVAFGVGTPVIALFGPTVKSFGFYPLGENDVVMEVDLKCRPCSLHGSNICPESHHNCMKMIRVDDVWEKVLNYLE